MWTPDLYWICLAEACTLRVMSALVSSSVSDSHSDQHTITNNDSSTTSCHVKITGRMFFRSQYMLQCSTSIVKNICILFRSMHRALKIVVVKIPSINMKQ